MDIKSKASITVDATLTSGEIYVAVFALPGAVEAILDAAQAGIAAAKGPSTATLASREVITEADGSVVARVVFEKVDQPAVTDAGQGASQDAAPEAPAAEASGEQPAASVAPVAPIGLVIPGTVG